MTKTKKYFLKRAAEMRQIAREAETEGLQKACLRAAEEFEKLAAKATGMDGDEHRISKARD